MPRRYTVSFENVTISAAQDLVALKGSTGKICRLIRFWLGMTNTALQTAQGLRLRARYSSATITLGSGGSAPTPAPLDPGDAAASFTCRVNDTTQATTSGAFSNVVPNGCHNYAGIDWSFERPPAFGLNEGIVIDLPSTVTGTCAFSGGAIVEEEGS